MPRKLRTTTGSPVNLLANPTPHPQSRALAWSARNGGLRILAEAAIVGTHGARAISTTTGQSFGVFVVDNYLLSAYGLSVGDTISARIEFRNPPSVSVQLGIRFQQGTTVLSQATGSAVSSGGVATVAGAVIPANCDNLFLFTVSIATAPNQAIDFDGAMVTKTATPPAAFTPGTAVNPGQVRVTSRAASVRPTTPTGPLQWSPPTLSSPLVVNVTDDPATRNVFLANGQDCILNLPSTPLEPLPDQPNTDSAVIVSGGRHVVCIGGHIRIPQQTTTVLTDAVDAADTTIPVASTTGFPSTGMFRIEGEPVTYTSKDATHFYGCTRNSGFFNTSAFTSLRHAADSPVTVGEYTRSGMTFKAQTGVRHVEGVLIDGYLIDGIRALVDSFALSLGTLQVQNCHIGPTRAIDQVYETDGHPDCVQFAGAPNVFRMDRVTMKMRDGRGLNNQGNTQSSPLHNADLRNVEMICEGPTSLGVSNVDKTFTTWAVTNSWIISPGGRIATDDTALDAKFNLARASQVVGQFVDPAAIGIGYTNTVGYLS